MVRRTRRPQKDSLRRPQGSQIRIDLDVTAEPDIQVPNDFASGPAARDVRRLWRMKRQHIDKGREFV